MTTPDSQPDTSLRIAEAWCKTQGPGWSLQGQLGKGGTAPVFEVTSPDGPRALKIYTDSFSSGEKGGLEEKRIQQQLSLRGHDCPFLVQIYDGGRFEGRLFLLMGRAPGVELEPHLGDVPRSAVRSIVDQVARATIFLRSRGLCHRDIKPANVFVSDDFRHATLLDISVVREINDPVGIGTDHDSQLPVVATARYSPPEYLFRLIPPGPELWHALNVYQLGALLHDLIMREPLFQREYIGCAENRYRFAWVVATAIPDLNATDVDDDLILLARRALDKDWKARSSLRLEDFLADAKSADSRARQLLGFGTGTSRPNPSTLDLSGMRARIRTLAEELDALITGCFRREGVTPVHLIHPGQDDTSRRLTFEWDGPSTSTSSHSALLTLNVTVALTPSLGKILVRVGLRLSRREHSGEERDATLPLPPFEDCPGVGSAVAEAVCSSLGPLAMKMAERVAERSA